MLRTRNEQPTLWESILPEELLRLPAELAGVDALLDDEALNEALLAKAAEAKLLRVGKVRADTTVVSANVDYPTDSGLLAKAVRRIGRIVTRVKAAGAATRTRCPDHSRSAGRRARQIASKLRLRGAEAKDEAQRVVRRATAALARL